MWEPDINLHSACPACGELVRASDDAVLGGDLEAQTAGLVAAAGVQVLALEHQPLEAQLGRQGGRLHGRRPALA